jgi:hypothetical protein
MTIMKVDAGRRIRPISEHAYTVPVVRELPPRPPDRRLAGPRSG